MLELGVLKLEAVRTQLAEWVERAEPAAPVLKGIKAGVPRLQRKV